jgi:hypothetical protein
MLGEHLEPVLPKLAELQRQGAVTTEKVQIVARAMHKLSRAGLDPEAVQTAEHLLTDYAPVLGPTDLHRYALRVIDAADPDGPEPVDEQLQHDRRYLELKQRRDGMWHLQGKRTTTLGAQLNAILDPLSKPRTSSIENDDGTVTQIADQRPYVQRMHDALDEMCGRVLKSADQPAVGRHLRQASARSVPAARTGEVFNLGRGEDRAPAARPCSADTTTHPLPPKGWNCRINADGLPEWIPPRWIDQQQRPQLNTRIQRLHAQHQQLRQRRSPKAA